MHAPLCPVMMMRTPAASAGAAEVLGVEGAAAPAEGCAGVNQVAAAAAAVLLGVEGVAAPAEGVAAGAGAGAAAAGAGTAAVNQFAEGGLAG